MKNKLKEPTEKEHAWAVAYVKDPNRNATQAARVARYAHPRVAGPRLLHRPHVMALVERLDAEARKRLKVRKPPKIKVEPPAKAIAVEVDAVLSPVEARQHAEQHAVASRSEVLAMCTNLVRTHESRRLGDLYRLTRGPSDAMTLVTDAEKLAELPLASVQELSHDEAGDIKLKLRDPFQAGKLLLDDHYRQRGDEDPMARPRQVVNIIMAGPAKDRRALDDLARRMTGMGSMGGNGDG